MSRHHAHMFYLRKGWWRHRVSWHRWECACGFRTRSYDSVDLMGTRPVHPHMTVALRGFNTTKRPKS